MKQVALFIIAVLLVISYGNMELHCKAESGLAGTGFSEGRRQTIFCSGPVSRRCCN